MGFRVFGVWGFGGLRFWDLGFQIQGFWVPGPRFRLQDIWSIATEDPTTAIRRKTEIAQTTAMSEPLGAETCSQLQHTGVSENRGPFFSKYSTLNSRILIIRTPE